MLQTTPTPGTDSAQKSEKAMIANVVATCRTIFAPVSSFCVGHAGGAPTRQFGRVGASTEQSRQGRREDVRGAKERATKKGRRREAGHECVRVYGGTGFLRAKIRFNDRELLKWDLGAQGGASRPSACGSFVVSTSETR